MTPIVSLMAVLLCAPPVALGSPPAGGGQRSEAPASGSAQRSEAPFIDERVTQPPGVIELRRGEQAMAAGDSQGAIPALEMAYLLRPGARALRLLGQALVAQRRYAYAVEVLQRLRLLVHGAERDAVDKQAADLKLWAATRLHVLSEPPGVAVYLDGQQAPLGQTPLWTAVPPGPHILRLTRADLVTRSVDVTAMAGADTETSVSLALYGCDLNLDSEPGGAVARVLPQGLTATGSEVAGMQTPISLRVPPGRYQVELALRGRASVSQHLVCQGDEVLALRGVLPPLPLGRLTVAAPRGALVRVDFCPLYDDGAPPRCAPAPQPLHGGSAEVLPGRHHIEVSQSGHRTWLGEGAVAAGEETRIQVPDLEPLPAAAVGPLALLARQAPAQGPPPRSRRRALLWSLVAVAGAAVVGGISAAVVLGTRSPSEAQFPAVLIH